MKAWSLSSPRQNPQLLVLTLWHRQNLGQWMLQNHRFTYHRHTRARARTHTHTISQTQIPAPWKLISFPALIRFLFPRSTLLLPTESAPAGSTRYLFHHLVCRAPHKAQAHSKLFTTTCRVSKQNYTHGTQHARSQSHSPLTHTPRPCDLPSPLLLRPNV